MANTVWKGQLTFGLVSFPVRLVRAARKDRIPLRLIRETGSANPDEEEETASAVRTGEPDATEHEGRGHSDLPTDPKISLAHQTYFGDQEGDPVAARELQQGFEVEPGQFAIVRSEELRRLRQPTSTSMDIVRSVHMEEIDPVFLETSCNVLPGSGGEHPYTLFYRALKESGYAALAEVAMHGRQHVLVLRPGAKGLIAHTMYYVNEVRSGEEHVAEEKNVAPKELELAKRFVEAIPAPFQPDAFSDRYREQLKHLVESKETISMRTTQNERATQSGKVIHIMDALKKSLDQAKSQKPSRKSAAPASAAKKSRKRRA
jgi:DNA end-binding protein Ku